MHGHVYTEARGSLGVSFLRSHPPCFVKPSFSPGSDVFWLGYAYCPVSDTQLSVSASWCWATDLYFLSGLTGLLCLSGVTGLHCLSVLQVCMACLGLQVFTACRGLQFCLLYLSRVKVFTACLPFKLVLWIELKPSSYGESYLLTYWTQFSFTLICKITKEARVKLRAFYH